MVLDGVFQQNIVNAINIANFSGKVEDWRVVGMYVGSIAAEVLNFRVPSY
jgi:hypothetical protein